MADHVQQRMQSEQEAKERKKQERDEAPFFTHVSRLLWGAALLAALCCLLTMHTDRSMPVYVACFGVCTAQACVGCSQLCLVLGRILLSLRHHSKMQTSSLVLAM